MSTPFFTLDVGHGLSQIVLLPGKRAIVIDGGPYETLEIVTDFLNNFVNQIELFVATHNDADHVGAAIHFLDMPRYRHADGLLKAVMLVDRGSQSPIPLLDYLRTRRMKKSLNSLTYACIDQKEPLIPRNIYEDENVSLDVLFPAVMDNVPSFRVREPRTELQNRTSACMRLVANGGSALITGDIDLVGLTKIVKEYGFSLSADVLVVPHHGGRIPGLADSLTWNEIIKEVHPALAVVSCGTKRTKVCSSNMLDLANNGVRILCTESNNYCDGPCSPIDCLDGIHQHSSIDNDEAKMCYGSLLVNFGNEGATTIRDCSCRMV